MSELLFDYELFIFGVVFVYYIEFALFFVLIRSLKKEICFVCQMLSYIFNCDATQ